MQTAFQFGVGVIAEMNFQKGRSWHCQYRIVNVAYMCPLQLNLILFTHEPWVHFLMFAVCWGSSRTFSRADFPNIVPSSRVEEALLSTITMTLTVIMIIRWSPRWHLVIYRKVRKMDLLINPSFWFMYNSNSSGSLRHPHCPDCKLGWRCISKGSSH